MIISTGILINLDCNQIRQTEFDDRCVVKSTSKSKQKENNAELSKKKWKREKMDTFLTLIFRYNNLAVKTSR